MFVGKEISDCGKYPSVSPCVCLGDVVDIGVDLHSYTGRPHFIAGLDDLQYGIANYNIQPVG